MLNITRTNNNSPFEGIKHLDEFGREFWLARELQPILEYEKWQNFESVINKAKVACVNFGAEPGDHFVETSKSATIGSGSTREIKDYVLTRYACSLVAMNGDPKKRAIAVTSNGCPTPSATRCWRCLG